MCATQITGSSGDARKEASFPHLTGETFVAASKGVVDPIRGHQKGPKCLKAADTGGGGGMEEQHKLESITVMLVKAAKRPKRSRDTTALWVDP